VTSTSGRSEKRSSSPELQYTTRLHLRGEESRSRGEVESSPPVRPPEPLQGDAAAVGSLSAALSRCSFCKDVDRYGDGDRSRCGARSRLRRRSSFSFHCAGIDQIGSPSGRWKTRPARSPTWVLRRGAADVLPPIAERLNFGLTGGDDGGCSRRRQRERPRSVS